MCEFITYKLVIWYGYVEGGGTRFQCDALDLDFIGESVHDTVPRLVKEYRKKLEGEGEERFAITPEVHLLTGDMIECACDN